MNRPTVAEINLKALDFNIKKLKEIAKSSKFFPVIKANAYGHGIKEISKRLENKVNGFCVATSEEAINLRSTTKKSILDLEGPYDSSDLIELIKNKIEFVIHSERQLDFLSKFKKFPSAQTIWIKFDIGLNRLGFSSDEIIQVADEISKKTNNLVLMSHFSHYQGSSNQLVNFKKVEKKLTSLKINFKSSLCNSGGMINLPDSQKNIVRPGLCIFGIKSNLKKYNDDLKPVMTLKSKFISIKDISKGEKVGYEGIWTAPKKSKIGILPIGFGDGYPTNLSNQGKVKIKDKLAPIIGKISMDMMAIDLSSFRDISYKDEVIIWGESHEVDKVAKYADNTEYSLLTGLSNRVKKIYKL